MVAVAMHRAEEVEPTHGSFGRVAIVHDYLTQRGGAERVVLSLLRLFPDADLYTSVYDPEGTYPEFREHHVRTTALQRLLPMVRDSRRLLPLYPRNFERLRLEGYDLVISSSSGFAHGVTVVDGTHVCYCYNPPRWLYRPDAYFGPGSPAPSWSKSLLHPVLSWLRRWDARAARRVDHYIAIGDEVARRIQHVYGKEPSAVVTPPVDVGRIEFGQRTDVDGEPYALVVSRLLPYKRVDLVVEACRQLGLRLVVVGEGPCLDDLRARRADHVDFRGRVSDAELNGLLRECVALVQAGVEDFGLGPLEANAAGRPAIAYAAGGALETVLDGKSGFLVYEQTAEAFADALDRAQREDWCAETIRLHAASFSEERFHRELTDVLSRCATAACPLP